MIQTKNFSQAEAAAAVAQGYVDLWAYALFNKAFVDAGYIKVNSVGNDVAEFLIQLGSNTYSYKITDEAGNFDNTGNIALFAPYENTNCPTRVHLQQGTGRGAQAFDFARVVCPIGAYGGSSSRSSSIYEESSNTEILTVDGEQWYAVRMHSIRYEYKQPQSFYTIFYKDLGLATGSTGATNCNIYGDDGKSLVWDGYATQACNYQDWSMTYSSPTPSMNECLSSLKAGTFDFIRGGVVVESSLSGTLTLADACPGDDLSASLALNAPAAGSWQDYEFSAALASLPNPDSLV